VPDLAFLPGSMQRLHSTKGQRRSTSGPTTLSPLASLRPTAGLPVERRRAPLVVDPLAVGHTVVEFGGDSRRPVGVVLIVDHPDPLGQDLVSGLTGGSTLSTGQPRVER